MTWTAAPFSTVRIFLPVCGFAVLALAACQSYAAPGSSEAWLNGRVVDTSGSPVQAELRIGEERFETDAEGRFSISPKPNLVYQIDLTAENYYAMRQTFSHAELAENVTLNDIALVARKPGRTLLVFGGDLMIGRRFYTPHEGEPVLVQPESVLEDSKALLAEMKPYLDLADYASINLETQIFEEPPSGAAPKSVTFYSKPETLDAIEWAGVDYVALGNNHTYDFLEPGLDATMDYLRASSLDHSGAGKIEAEALKAHRESFNQSQFDFLSYVGWAAGPPTQSAEADKGGAALGTQDNILATTRRSVSDGGLPVLQFHGGLEYVEEPTLSMETKLKRAVDEGAALVVGHHPHVVQGLELYNGKLMAWSLGNFLFDQYFYSAQSAALLYVWMDGDEFFHAETVPIYIKGYRPTPAVGPMRDQINQRLFELSKKRDTNLRVSGGHLVLHSKGGSAFEKPHVSSAFGCRDDALRQGKDLLARGDFDSYDLFDAPDRSWLDLDPRITLTADFDEPWDKALSISLGKNDSLTTGMRKFTRVFSKGTPMSIRAEIDASAPALVTAYLQIRADGQSLFDALEDGKKVLLGNHKLVPGQSSKLDIEFDSPRVRARSIRILLDIETEGTSAEVEIDNLELIEWQTPFEPHSELTCSR